MGGEKDAPADMPGDVERAFNLAARAMQRRFGASGTEEEIEAALSEFFAPILAERAAGWRAYASAAEAAHLLNDRALAAEAALAGERERCIAIVDAQVPDWVKERSGPYWDGYREAMEDAAEDMRKGVPARAAAIRAQGE